MFHFGCESRRNVSFFSGHFKMMKTMRAPVMATADAIKSKTCGRTRKWGAGCLLQIATLLVRHALLQLQLVGSCFCFSRCFAVNWPPRNPLANQSCLMASSERSAAALIVGRCFIASRTRAVRKRATLHVDASRHSRPLIGR